MVKGSQRNQPGAGGQKLKDLAGQPLPWYDQLKPPSLSGGTQFTHSKCHQCPKEGWSGSVAVGIGGQVGLVVLAKGDVSAEWQVQRSFSWKDVEGKVKGSISIEPKAVARVYVFGSGSAAWTKVIN